jgi:uncharacterized protein (DUF2252 family)
MTKNHNQTVEERTLYGKSLRKQSSRASHGEWSPTADRPDPISLLEEQNKDRLDWLIPVRRWRMSASPFAFFRGSARIMAADLATTPVTGLEVQVCGDAHLANFGLFASPERRLVFDINDFDETLAGPWEWDIKRLAASFAIAARHNGLKKKDARKATERVVRTYRKAMAGFAGMRNTDIWYAMLHEDQIDEIAAKEGRKTSTQKLTEKAKTKDSLQALGKLAEKVNGEFRIKSDPPGVVPLRDFHNELELSGRSLRELADNMFEAYRQTVPENCKRLLDRYRLIDVALKAVGVGSVGNRCLILLLEGRDTNDPLFLQMKQATPSVLEEYHPSSPYKNQGQRVVEGQRLMQTVGDIFLGWIKGDISGADFYCRQLRDWKGSADVDNLSAPALSHLARLCGWTLARAHARSGDPVAIAGYLGKSDSFDKALVGFANSYADQNERDFKAFTDEISNGKLKAIEG